MAAYGQCQYAEDCRFAHSAEISPYGLASLLQEAGLHAPLADTKEKTEDLAPVSNKCSPTPYGTASLRQHIALLGNVGGSEKAAIDKIPPINVQCHYDEMDCPDLIPGSESDPDYESDTADEEQSDSSDDCYSIDSKDTPRAVQQPDLATTTKNKWHEGETHAQTDITQLDIVAAFYDVSVPDTNSIDWRWDETHEFDTNFPLNWGARR
jgi:hypothetical protein